MSTSVGNINFGVGIDASRLSAELQRHLDPAVAIAQAKLNQKPLKIKFEVADLGRHVDAAIGIAQAKLDQKPLKVTANVDLDIQGAIDHARTVLAATHLSLDVNVNINVNNLAQSLAALQGLTDHTVRIRIEIDVDEAQLARVSALLQGIRSQTTNVRVNTNADDANRGIARIGTTLSGLAKFTGIAAAIGAGIAAIGGAAGAAAGAVGVLGAGLLALAPAAAAVGATALVGLRGMKDAFTALGNVSQNAAAESKTHVKAVAAAQNSLSSALDGVRTATSTLNSAQRESARAAEDVGKAYREAEQDLASYELRLKGASLTEREARLNLAEAQKQLREGKFTDPLERERAILRVERAQLDLTEAEKANKDLQEEATDAQKKGVEGSAKVIAAKEKQQQADERVAEALAGVARANAQVAQAQQALTDAQNEALPSAEKFSEALANLSPNAQAFVLAFRDLQPALTEFRMAIQDSLFDQLGADLKLTADTVLPAVRDGMSGVAAELNAAARNALEFLRSARGIDGINTAFANTESLLRGMRSGTGEFTQGLLDIGTAAKPVMEDLGRSISSVFEGIGRAFSQSKESGELTRVFQGFADALKGIGSLLEGFVSALLTIGDKVAPALKPFFESFGGALKEIAPSLGELGKVFVESLTKIMPELAILIRALAEGLKPVLPVIADLLIAIGHAIQPLIGPLSELAVSVGNTLVDVFKALEPSLKPLADAFVSIFNAVSPLIPLFAESLSAILEALAPAIKTIADALAPVIKMFADQMQPVLEELKPVLQETASTIGLALADAIKEIAPLLPDLVSSFGDLIIAVIPLLPELIRLALEVMPPLISIMKDAIPIIQDMIDAFTWFVENVITPFVIPALQMMAEQWGDTFGQIADIVHFFTDTVLPKIAESLQTIGNEFSRVVEWIGNTWATLSDKLAVPVNFVIRTVLNDGLFKAWNSVSDLLGGSLGHVDPLAEIPRKAKGGPSLGKGTGTSDEILTWLSNGEHVVTAAEVLKAGGHNILFAIRDMIARGIPFTWNNGQIIADLGKDNLNNYGAAVASKGIGNVPPEGLFDSLIPKFQSGGPILPWMYQLQKGHDFARAQNGKPYKWAGPQFQGDSFDCSGFMGAIAAAILGMNPWQRYWATGSFNGQQVGPQGFTKNALDGGFVVGISNGGEGGGHTAGVLGAIAELGYQVARVESGGSIGDVHYGRGTDPRSFQMLYGLPIGANGFFQPGEGGPGGTVGPTPSDQMSFLAKTIKAMIEVRTLPVRAAIKAIIGDPPPLTRNIPPSFLDKTENAMAVFLAEQPGKLGDALGGVWQRATDLGGRVLDAINPFDSGGIASGTGVLTKNVIEPERILSPEQTRLFEALVESLQSIAGSPSASVPNLLTADVFSAGIALLAKNIGDAAARQEAARAVPDQEPTDTEQQSSIQILGDKIDKIVVTTQDLVLRTESSRDLELATQAAQIQSGLDNLAQMLTDQALIPIMESAVSEGIGILRKWLDAGADQVTAGTDRTTSAVLSTAGGDGGGSSAPFGAPGSSFDAVSAISDAIVGVANTARQAFESVANSIAQAALAQTPSKADPSKGRLGTDISGGTLVDTLVRLTGVEIDIRDTLVDTWEEIHAFRGDLVAAFDESGRVITDTADLVQRNESSRELVVSEMERINKALIKALIKYLILNVLLPIITAILGAMITLATTAIGAAIGSMIPIIGTAIGAAVGAVIGAALAGLASVFTSVLAVGAGAAIDAFDSGGEARGVGLLQKNIIAPERVLSPRQTEDFGRLVDVLDRSMGRRANVTVNAPFTVLGGSNAGQQAHTDLLSLINGG